MRKIMILFLCFIGITGCSKNEILCKGTINENGITYDMEVKALLNEDVVEHIFATLTFTDQETADNYCKAMESLNRLTEEETTIIDYSCNKRVLSIYNYEYFLDEEDFTLIGSRKESFIQYLHNKENGFLCK